MNSTKNDINTGLRIVWIIAAKDIIDALKNKKIASGIVTVFFLMVMYRWLPTLYDPGRTDLVLFDAGNSRLVTELVSSPRFRVWEMGSLSELQEMMRDGDNGQIGLAIPAGFDGAIDSEEPLPLEGYRLWGSRSAVTELKSDLEQQLAGLVNRPIRIQIQGTVYPKPDAMGDTRAASITLVVTLFFMGVFTVPHLMLEEKRARTLDTLLISPASVSQVVMGKALAGVFYCLVTAVVALAFYQALVVNWILILLAILCGILFTIGMGLALGTFLENKQQLGIWILILSHPLLIPLFLSALEPILPAALRSILPWMPMVAQALLFRYAFSTGATFLQVLTSLGIALGSALLLFALVIWKVHQMDR